MPPAWAGTSALVADVPVPLALLGLGAVGVALFRLLWLHARDVVDGADAYLDSFPAEWDAEGEDGDDVEDPRAG
jgi:hypothetical protein